MPDLILNAVMRPNTSCVVPFGAQDPGVSDSPLVQAGHAQRGDQHAHQEPGDRLGSQPAEVNARRTRGAELPEGNENKRTDVFSSSSSSSSSKGGGSTSVCLFSTLVNY